MQSLSSPWLCFVLLPILTIAPEYRLELSSEDLRRLDLPADRQPVIGHDVLCAAIICTDQEEGHTANLLAPLVVNLRSRRGLQTIQMEGGYSINIR